MTGVGSFFSSLFTTTHADAEEKPATEAASDDAGGEESPKEEEAEAEAEEEEPEDAHPAIREECSASPGCAPMRHHFEKCQEKVQAGEGQKHEDCVEEILMHCSEACAAPKVFAQLK